MTEEQARLKCIELVESCFQRGAVWEDNHNRAKGILITLRKNDTCESETIASLGAIYSNLGEHSKAYELLKDLVDSRSPDFRQAYFNLAVSMMNIGEQRPHAIKLFEKASSMEKSPSTVEAYFDPQGY